MKIPQTCHVLVHLLKEQFTPKNENLSHDLLTNMLMKSREVSRVVFEAECLEVPKIPH